MISIRPATAIARPALPWDTGWSIAGGYGDWSLAGAAADNPAGLAATSSIATAVLLSLFTDRRAPDFWRRDVADRRGSWHDDLTDAPLGPQAFGSWLWLLENEVLTEATREAARLYCEEALAWLTAERVAAAVTVEVEVLPPPASGLAIRIVVTDRTGAQVFDGRFTRLWNQV